MLGTSESHLYKNKTVEGAHLSSFDVSGVVKGAENSTVGFSVGLHAFRYGAAGDCCKSLLVFLLGKVSLAFGVI